MATPGQTLPRSGLYRPNMSGRRLRGRLFNALGVLSVAVGLGLLLVLLIDVVRTGAPHLDVPFLTSLNSRNAEEAGLVSALVGTVILMGVTIAVALPLGILTAIYLEEYAGDNWFTRFVQINIANLAAVPSIIYGLLGLQVFVRLMYPITNGRSLLAGALTMALLVLPIIIVASREAIRAVPPSMREASLALGATQSQTVRHHVLPYAISGILTGNILAASRAIGETAPLLAIAFGFLTFVPTDLRGTFTVLPVQIYQWTSAALPEFQALAAAGIIVLLVVLLLMNSLAIYLRQRLRTRY